MNSTAPWWGISLFTLATGVVTGLITAFAALSPARTERRIESRRLSRDHKEKSYPTITRVAYNLITASIWFTTAEERHKNLQELITSTHEAAFFAPTHVVIAIHELLTAATTLTTTQNDIRATTQPGHQGTIDVARADEHAQVLDRVRTALQTFVDASRADLEIPGNYPVLVTPPPQLP